MFYLLYSSDNHDRPYLLISRTDGIEAMYDYGTWCAVPPHTSTQLAAVDTDPIPTRNGKPIPWWQEKYYEYADAVVIHKCKSLDAYLKWVSTHPEYFI